MTEIRVRFDLTFSRRFLAVSAAAAMMLCAVPELDSESVTLSTYYPAPSGVYTNMITTGHTYLARDVIIPGGAESRVGIGTTGPTAKLDVNGAARFRNAVGGAYGLTPSYANWSAYGQGDGGAAIYNSNEASYQALMLVGNSSGGSHRRVKVWDELTVNGSSFATDSFVSRKVTCTDTSYTEGVVNCPGGQYATFTSGVMVKRTLSSGTTDPNGKMLCCPCPAGGCPNL